MARNSKLSNMEQRAQQCAFSKNIRYSRHAIDESMLELFIDDRDVIRVLENGRHNPRHDEWDSERHEWTYAIDGEAIEGDEIRAIVKFGIVEFLSGESQLIVIISVFRTRE
jgi:hypothetical protein